MIVRREQVEALESPQTTEFESSVIRHLRDTCPGACGVLGEAGVRDAARYARERAGTYGISKAANVMLFADLTLRLGRSFDTDPQLPWVLAILRNALDSCQNRRSRELHSMAMDFLHRTLGPAGEFYWRAWERFSSEPAVEPGAGYLERVFPEKYREIGGEAGQSLVDAGIRKAERFGMRTARGRQVYVTLMFLLGAGFAEDPLFVWAAEALQRDAPEPNRAEALYQAAIAHVRHWYTAGAAAGGL